MPRFTHDACMLETPPSLWVVFLHTPRVARQPGELTPLDTRIEDFVDLAYRTLVI